MNSTKTFKIINQIFRFTAPMILIMESTRMIINFSHPQSKDVIFKTFNFQHVSKICFKIELIGLWKFSFSQLSNLSLQIQHKRWKGWERRPRNEGEFEFLTYLSMQVTHLQFNCVYCRVLLATQSGVKIIRKDFRKLWKYHWYNFINTGPPGPPGVGIKGECQVVNTITKEEVRRTSNFFPLRSHL